jgi:two-component system response regulator LytT
LFDVVFLDIELPDKLGLEIAKLLKETYRNIIIAFVTSFDNYVYDAFDYDV